MPFRAAELGNTSYLVADPDSGEAVVVDPFRDVDQYLVAAETGNLRIKLSLETHVHNDFVSGGRELEHQVGATIGAAHDAGLDFPFQGLRDGQELPLGPWCMQVRHTPGHTASHISYVLSEDGRPVALFSGGALMVGSAARTDLFGPHRAFPLARELFRTLHARLAELPDDVAVYPTHGAGSFCGAASDGPSTSSMGAERATNPLLQDSELLPFLARILNQKDYPAYYRGMTRLNQEGAPLRGRQLPPLAELAPIEGQALLAGGAAVIDIREPLAYDRGHIAGSFSVSLVDQPFSAWVGWILGPERRLVLAGGSRHEQEEARRQLFRIGYDNVVGGITGAPDEWRAAGLAVSTFETGDVDALAAWMETASEPLTVLDVRDDDEWAHGHVPGAVHMTVPQVQEQRDALPADTPVVVHCASGFRAAIAASILEQAGFRRLTRIEGGFPDWEDRGLPAVHPGRD